MNKVLYFVQLPPPRHGVSVLNEIICESEVINDGMRKSILPIRFTSNHQDLNKINLKKLLAMVGLTIKLFWRLLTFRPNVVYFTLTPSGIGFLRDLLFVSVFKMFRIETIYHLHGVGIVKSIMRKPNLKKLYRYAFRNATIIHLSKGLLKSEVLDVFPEFKHNCYSLVNGVESSRIEKSTSLHCKDILFLSNLKRSKGVFDLLSIFKGIHNEFSDAHLNIAGGSTSTQVDEEIKSTIVSLGLSGSVTLHGFVSGLEKQKLLAKADLFLHPTHDDALPLVLLEAMKYGIPIVATNIGAIGEIIDDGVNGYVVECGDCQAMTKTSIELLNSVTRRSEIEKNARSIFYEKYSLEVFQNEFKLILHNVLK
jgi:glycosyltransferase involved in cell wall biosynthesis